MNNEERPPDCPLSEERQRREAEVKALWDSPEGEAVRAYIRTLLEGPNALTDIESLLDSGDQATRLVAARRLVHGLFSRESVLESCIPRHTEAQDAIWEQEACEILLERLRRENFPNDPFLSEINRALLEGLVESSLYVRAAQPGWERSPAQEPGAEGERPKPGDETAGAEDPYGEIPEGKAREFAKLWNAKTPSEDLMAWFGFPSIKAVGNYAFELRQFYPIIKRRRNEGNQAWRDLKDN